MKFRPTEAEKPVPFASRRSFLRAGALGIGALAAADLCARESGSQHTLPHDIPRAKRMIVVFLEGGFSQMDTWDFKPALGRHFGKPLPDSIRPPSFTFAPQGTVIPSPFSWKHYGQSGHFASDLFPELNERFIDDLCFIHSLHHRSNDHVTAKTVFHTGVPIEVRPTMGSWLLYGLGTENENLPGYIDITPGEAVRPTGFLPGRFGATAIDRPDPKKPDLMWENLRPQFPDQDRHIRFIQSLDETESAQDSAHPVAKKIGQMELAFRMQTEAPELLDLQTESEETRKLYGIGDDHTDEFGRALLLARRFSEAGVRYITVNHATKRYGNHWDQHSDLEKGHRGNAHSVDKPIAGLLHDLRHRGLLDDTLVLCATEFGRTPTFEFFTGESGKQQNGRDHNPHGFTIWLAGAGVKKGYRHGRTDDFGYYATEGKAEIHDLHATLLKLMGINHRKLTYFHNGRDYRLTDVYGNVIREILT